MLSDHSVRNSIDVNIKDPNGRTLFHVACDNGHKDVVQLIRNLDNIQLNYGASLSVILPVNRVLLICKSRFVRFLRIDLAKSSFIDLLKKIDQIE